MDLVPWQPFREMERMRNTFDRLFTDPVFSPALQLSPAVTAFPAEVLEQGNEVVVRCELAGMDPNDVDVRITDQGVVIRGERKVAVEQKERGTYRSERFYGSFSRSLPFPVPVDSDQATASFRHGLLEVRAPKRNPDTGRDGRRLSIETQH